jgi:hypothetical protein
LQGTFEPPRILASVTGAIDECARKSVVSVQNDCSLSPILA